MLNSRKVVEYPHPYTENPVGPGRWFTAYAETHEEIGYVWTNDRAGFSIIVLNPTYDAQPTLDWFLYSRNIWGEAGTQATDAFESYFEMQNTWAPDGVQIQAGDLELDLMERVRREMTEVTGFIEYGITVRDDGEVLELVRNDPTGTYLRENGRWVAIDAEAAEDTYPTVYNQEWVEVDEDIIEFYDQNSGSTGINLRDVQLYII